MKNSFSFLAICAVTLVLILIVVSYYLFSKIAASTKTGSEATGQAGGDALRKHGVTDLASKISFLTSDESMTWPDEWKQIGTSTEGCQIQNMHCQVAASECFNLQEHSQNKFKLPMDSVGGSAERTGYALKLSDNTLYIRACYTDGDEVISQELRL